AKFISLEEARQNKFAVDWKAEKTAQPSFTGTRVLTDYDMEEIKAYIDWTPFFHSWELKGAYPKILNDPERGTEAQKLFKDAQEMLKKIITEKWLQANAVVGIFPAASVGADDIELDWKDEKDQNYLFHTLRQQTKKPAGQANIALADFVRPKENGRGNDFIGAFALTTGIGIDERVAAFEKDHDDYSAILLKALADRLAEAFAELLHKKVRTDYWPYAAGETLSNEELIQETYQGIRPAPGYPAQPDHTEKETIWKLLEVEKNTGIILTDSLAMAILVLVKSPKSKWQIMPPVKTCRLKSLKGGWDLRWGIEC
ncbi:MAG: methionine synthase, partial [Sphingobacteriia bacterium]|nr:methionine synthase [Sphingobacteriia bacterium]